jgi:vacuole morphology and inheritance protein 14
LSTRSKIGRDEIKWQELLLHFRSVQAKHEKARRQALGNDTSPIIGFPEDKVNDTSDRVGRPGSGRLLMRRRATGEISESNNIDSQPSQVGSRSGALSPLNPKARAPSGLTGLIGASSSGKLTPNLALGQAQKQRRPLEPTRK